MADAMKTLREQIRRTALNWEKLKLDMGLECARLALEAAKAKETPIYEYDPQTEEGDWVDAIPVKAIDALLEELSDGNAT